MGPKERLAENGELFLQRLSELINLKHPLVKLSGLIDWSVFETRCSSLFLSKTGRPASSPRLIAGLLYLQHSFGCSDEELISIWIWIENPYWQYFCGQTYFCHEAPIDPSSLTRWRKRIGEEGVEQLLSETIAAAHRMKLIQDKSFDRVIVDTTVMEKAIAYPTDSQLLEKGRQHLVRLAEKTGITLRQNYNRLAPRLAIQTGRYAHAKQYLRMKASLKSQRTLVGRIWRDIKRKLDWNNPKQTSQAAPILKQIKRLLDQKPKDKNKRLQLACA